MAASLEAIWVKRFSRGPMDPVTEANFVKDRGMVGNANQGGKRQVTVISREAMTSAAAELQRDVPPAVRRANLLVTGIDLRASRGKVLKVGGLRLLIQGETRPCERMDEAIPGLQKALDPAWRGGVYGIVLEDAAVAVGDPVTWE